MKRLTKYLVYGMIVSICLFIILLFINPTGSQLNVLYEKGLNPYNDFYNVMIYIADGDPYHNTLNGLAQKPYLPLSYLIMSLFSGFTDFSGHTCVTCLSEHNAVVACLIFTIISIFVFIHSILCLLRGRDLKTLVLVLFSYAFIFTIERGNLIFLAVSCLNYFLAFYHSENLRLRFFSILSLCLVSVLKVYPVVFGLLLLKEKRYKEILLCVIISIPLSFLPFLCFEGGFENISQLLTNLKENSLLCTPSYIFPRYGIAPSFAPLLKVTSASKEVSNLVFGLSNIITAILALISIVEVGINKVTWKSIALLSVTIIMFPTNSAIYCSLYIFPALFMFLNKNGLEKRDYFYCFMFFIILCPLQIEVMNMPVKYLIDNVAFVFMWCFLLYDMISHHKSELEGKWSVV